MWVVFLHFLSEAKMDVRNKQSIQEHLQNEEVQERILHNIHKGRDEATVTISRAAELFGITENKLRDWEEYGILNPLRLSGPKGRRLYTPTELDKLAIIRELINSGYAVSEIPSNINTLWHTTRSLLATIKHSDPSSTQANINELSINQRLTQSRIDIFWSYFVTHTLRLALKLICEDIPNTTAGLLLPLSPDANVGMIRGIEDLKTLGETLVGWLNQSGTSQTLLTNRPWFQYSSDFRVEHLQVRPLADAQPALNNDKTLLIVQRETGLITLSSETLETLQRLLRPIYENAARSRECLGAGMRDIIESATDFYTSVNYDDTILNGLADMIIHMGGTTNTGEPRWCFCWVLLPRDASQPANMSNLILRAQSQDPLQTKKMTLTTLDKHTTYPYIRALQSRHVIYQPNIPPADAQTGLRDQQTPIRSSFAMPIAGEDGLPLGVLYVTSHICEAFSLADQRILRLMCRMIEELLKTYSVRQQSTRYLTDIIKRPEVIDTLFESFMAENAFNAMVETLLLQRETTDAETITDEKGAVPVHSFIALEIDKYSSLANKYGDRLVRNLAREVGLRIQEQIRTLFKEYPDCQLYHIYADRFFILLKNISLEQAREHAERLRLGAIGSYKLDVLRAFADQQTRHESMVELTDITIRLGITSYSYPKLSEILRTHTPEYAIPEVRSIITSALDVALVKGQIEGGNVVISWDDEQHNFFRWSPPKK
jgi:DNA-binding transcriptional MerR regulator/GGDEF domain-containing protein